MGKFYGGALVGRVRERVGKNRGNLWGKLENHCFFKFGKSVGDWIKLETGWWMVVNYINLLWITIWINKPHLRLFDWEGTIKKYQMK